MLAVATAAGLPLLPETMSVDKTAANTAVSSNSTNSRSVCATIPTQPALPLFGGLFGPCVFGNDFEVVQAALNTRARGAPLPFCHVSLGVPERHAVGQAVVGSSLFRLLRGRGRISAPRLWPTRTLWRLS